MLVELALVPVFVFLGRTATTHRIQLPSIKWPVPAKRKGSGTKGKRNSEKRAEEQTTKTQLQKS